MMSAEALLSFAASLIGAVVGAVAALTVAARMRERQYKLEDRSELLVRKLLEHQLWKLRTFKTIKHHVAGFEDDELRRILIRSGALRFEDAMGVEVWGLLDRNLELLDREVGTRQN
jgi:hypothetical protein